jgi:hypothetical protein
LEEIKTEKKKNGNKPRIGPKATLSPTRHDSGPLTLTLTSAMQSPRGFSLTRGPYGAASACTYPHNGADWWVCLVSRSHHAGVCDMWDPVLRTFSPGLLASAAGNV